MSYRRWYAVAILTAVSAAVAQSQGVPTSQPGLIHIFIEEVKTGMNADHAKNEAGWPAAAEKSKSPYNYIALTSMTGRNEAWYVSTYKDHAAVANQMKIEDADAALTAEFTRLSKADAQYLNGTRSIDARARLDLSYGTFPNIATQRFWEITWFRVKPGHEAEFEAAAKAYGSASKRSAPTSSFRMYEVIAGLPGPTFIAFSSVAGYAEFDKAMAQGTAVWTGATKAEMAALNKASLDGLINTETQRFRLDAGQSYVTKEVADQDPAFWRPKKPAPKPGGGN